MGLISTTSTAPSVARASERAACTPAKPAPTMTTRGRSWAGGPARVPADPPVARWGLRTRICLIEVPFPWYPSTTGLAVSAPAVSLGRPVVVQPACDAGGRQNSGHLADVGGSLPRGAREAARPRPVAPGSASRNIRPWPPRRRRAGTAGNRCDARGWPAWAWRRGPRAGRGAQLSRSPIAPLSRSLSRLTELLTGRSPISRFAAGTPTTHAAAGRPRCR